MTWRYFILNLPNHPLFQTQFVTKSLKIFYQSCVRYKEGLYKIQGKWDQNLSYKARLKIAGRSFLKLLDFDSMGNSDATHRTLAASQQLEF